MDGIRYTPGLYSRRLFHRSKKEPKANDVESPQVGHITRSNSGTKRLKFVSGVEEECENLNQNGRKRQNDSRKDTDGAGQTQNEASRWSEEVRQF